MNVLQCMLGETTGDMDFVFEQKNNEKPIYIKLEYMFVRPPRKIMEDSIKEIGKMENNIKEDVRETLAALARG